jgi:hypothetical protein
VSLVGQQRELGAQRGRLAAGDHRRGAGVGEAINPSPLVSE